METFRSITTVYTLQINEDGKLDIKGVIYATSKNGVQTFLQPNENTYDHLSEYLDECRNCAKNYFFCDDEESNLYSDGGYTTLHYFQIN